MRKEEKIFIAIVSTLLSVAVILLFYAIYLLVSAHVSIPHNCVEYILPVFTGKGFIYTPQLICH